MSDLRSQREELVRELEAVDSAESLFDFQLRLVKAIQEVESAAHVARDDDARFHLRQLRIIGDSIAWQYLHPYAIRKLKGPPAGPPSLSSQGKAFENTIEMARKYVERGEPVLISDLTNVIGIGDVVVCTDPERPLVAESGGSLHHMGKGRKGRQMRRAMAALSILFQGRGRFEGDAGETVTVEVDLPLEHSWEAVESSTMEALDTGRAGRVVAEGDALWATRDPEESLDPPGDVQLAASSFARPCVAVNARTLDDPDQFIPPPLVWPIGIEARLALFERDVVIVHVVDLEAFTRVEHPTAQISEVRVGKEFIDAFCFVVTWADGRQELSHRFLNDVLYGFSTIESTARVLMEFALAASAIEGSESDGPSGEQAQDIAVVTTMEEARALGAELRSGERTVGYVATTDELFEEMLRQSRRPE